MFKECIFFVTTGHSSHPVCLLALGGSCSDSNIAVETCRMCSKTEVIIFLYPKCAMSNSNSWKSYFYILNVLCETPIVGNHISIF